MTHSIAIVGGGVAGITCYEWLETLGLEPTLYAETDELGGILNRVFNSVNDYPPATYEDGQILARAFAARTVDFARRIDQRVERIERRPNGWFVDDVRYDVVVLATGTVYRMLGLPGEREGLGRYVSQSASRDFARVAGQPVAVVGGGDAALENALILAQHGCHVALYSRSAYRARDEFRGAVERHEAIDLQPIGVLPTELVETDGGCSLTDSSGKTFDVACVFVRIGVDPQLPTLDPEPITVSGFIAVDRNHRSDLDGLYAIGDITDSALRCVAASVGDGARAAKAIWKQAQVNDV